MSCGVILCRRHVKWGLWGQTLYQGVPEQETVLPIQPCCVVRTLRSICLRFAFWQERFSGRLHPCMPTRRLCSDLIFYFRQVLLCGFQSLSIRFFSLRLPHPSCFHLYCCLLAGNNNANVGHDPCRGAGGVWRHPKKMTKKWILCICLHNSF